jgi:hypothetical protein
MRDHRLLSAGKNPGQHSTRPGNEAMPNRERSTEEWVKIAPFGTKGNLAIAQPNAAELPPRHHPMLFPRQPSNRMIQASGAPFALHGYIRRTGAGFAPRSA